MPRGRGIKRNRGGCAGTIDNVEGGSQLQDTSGNDILETAPTSQQVVPNRPAVSFPESFQQPIHASLNIGGQQTTPTSHGIGSQQATQDISTHQPTLPSHRSSNPRVRRRTHGIRSLEVNGDTFHPHDAVRDVTFSFKKAFTGPWHSWGEVPELTQNQWFSDFEKNYTFAESDRASIRKIFDHVGSERLSGSFGKAKKKFAEEGKIPTWISPVHWNIMMQYWNSAKFKKLSAINSKNRSASNGGEGPSLHTGGSVAFVEYKRRHKERTGQELQNAKLYLKTHKTKNEKKWVCGKSKRMWDTFTGIIMENVDETLASRNEDDLEEDGVDMEIDIATNGDDEGQNSGEGNNENLLNTIPEEQLAKAWLETVGGAKKGKIYGFGSQSCFLGDSIPQVNCASSSAPTPNVQIQQVFETPEFKQLLNQAMEKQMTDMQANLQAGVREDLGPIVEAAVRTVIGRFLFLSPQAPPNNFGSAPTPPNNFGSSPTPPE